MAVASTKRAHAGLAADSTAYAQGADTVHHLPGLNWVRLEGAEECAAAPSIARSVEGRVKRLAFGAVDEADVFVDGFVSKSPNGGWDVQLAVSTPDGHIWGRRDMHFDEPTALYDGPPGVRGSYCVKNGTISTF